MAIKNDFLGGIVGLKKNGNKGGSRLALRKQEAEKIIRDLDLNEPSEKPVTTVDDIPVVPEIAVTDNNVQDVLSNFAPKLLNIKISLNDLEEAPDDWNFFPSPDSETMTLLCRSIYQQGQLSPALVWEQDNGKYMILGGHTRAAVLRVLFEAYQENRFMTMTCHVYGKDQITSDEAQQIIIMNNMTQRAKESTTLMMRSVVRMVELEKASRRLVWGEKNPRINDIIAEKFHTSSSTIKRLYALRNLIPELVMLLENNSITNKLAIRFSMLPSELQRIIVDRQIYDRSFTEQQLRNLPSAKTEAELLDILASRPSYYFTGGRVQLDEPLPSDFKKFSLAVASRDLPLIKDILREAANNSSYQLTDETRFFLKKILN